jgi:hypothetical protein
VVALFVTPQVVFAVYVTPGPVFSETVSQSNTLTSPRNIILFYDDYPVRGDPEFQVTQQIVTPLVAHLDKDGKPTDWMFDSFIFFSYWLYEDKNPTKSYVSSWIKYIFEGKQIANLDASVHQLKTALNQPNYRMNVFLTIPVALDDYKLASITKNVDKLLTDWNHLNPRDLNLIGFYWGFTEDIISDRVQGLETLIPQIAAYVHSKGLKLLMIPFLNTQYSQLKLHQLGFDYVTVQPNYAWNQKNDLNRFARVNAMIVGGYVDGAEFELPVDSVKCCDTDWRVNFQTYIEQAKLYGWNRNRVATYYFGSDISKMGRDPNFRSSYEVLYQYILTTRPPG